MRCCVRRLCWRPYRRMGLSLLLDAIFQPSLPLNTGALSQRVTSTQDFESRMDRYRDEARK